MLKPASGSSITLEQFMDHETAISHSEIIFQLFLAALLGGLIGLERERKSWLAVC